MKGKARYADGQAIEVGDAVLTHRHELGRIVEILEDAGEIKLLYPRGAVGPWTFKDDTWPRMRLIQRRSADTLAEGRTWLEGQARRGLAEAQVALAKLLYRDFDFDGAARQLKLAAKKDYPPAVTELAHAYLSGDGVAESEKKAITLFRRAADLGDAGAQHHLGLAYMDGAGVRKSLVKARQYWNAAAKQGEPEATYWMGRMHAFGIGVPQSDTKAIPWFRRAAELGHAEAQFHLALRLFRQPQPDYVEVMGWYRASAAQDFAPALCNLADKYEHGVGVEQDFAQAHALYERAAAKGIVEAMDSLGNMYLAGKGVRKSKKQAIEWFTKAAGRGYGPAAAALQRLQG